MSEKSEKCLNFLTPMLKIASFVWLTVQNLKIFSLLTQKTKNILTNEKLEMEIVWQFSRIKWQMIIKINSSKLIFCQ